MTDYKNMRPQRLETEEAMIRAIILVGIVCCMMCIFLIDM